MIPAADAKEVRVGDPAEETIPPPESIELWPHAHSPVNHECALIWYNKCMDVIRRTPRFKRCLSPRIMRLTDRDAEIIRQVQKHRFLRSTHITALVGGSPQPILRRLHLLYHNGYLDRPRAQIDYYHQGGSRTMVYGLSNRGADVLQRRFGILRPRIDWIAKNQSVKPIYLQHTLMVADVMVSLERGCRQNHKVRLIEPEEIANQLPLTSFQWHVQVNHDGETNRLGIMPDKVFGLQFAGRPPGRDTAYFFLEADRATMPVTRRGLQRTSVFQKMLAYYETWRQHLHTALFNFHRFRVLTVTTSPMRAQNILLASQSLNGGKGSSLFLVADGAKISSHPNLLTFPIWSGRSGEIVQLIDG